MYHFLSSNLTNTSICFCAAQNHCRKKCEMYTLQGTNISPKNGSLKMIFLFPRWDMLIPWRVHISVGLKAFRFEQHNQEWCRCAGSRRSAVQRATGGGCALLISSDWRWTENSAAALECPLVPTAATTMTRRWTWPRFCSARKEL